MMIIAATIWSAIIVMIVAFFHRLIIFVWNVTLLRQKILRPKSTQIIIDPDSSMHSEISENSRTPLENNPNMVCCSTMYLIFLRSWNLLVSFTTSEKEKTKAYQIMQHILPTLLGCCRLARTFHSNRHRMKMMKRFCL